MRVSKGYQRSVSYLAVMLESILAYASVERLENKVHIDELSEEKERKKQKEEVQKENRSTAVMCFLSYMVYVLLWLML